MDRIQSWAINRDNLKRLVPLIQERTERLADVLPQVDYLLGDRKLLSSEDFEHKKLESAQVVQIIDHLSRIFDELRTWEGELLYQSCQNLADFLELKFRDLLAPVFVALSGRAVSLPLFDSMVFLGSDITRVRLREALAVLGVSGKQRKRLEKSYRSYRVWLVASLDDGSGE